MPVNQPSVIGLLPAGGQARRISPLPLSKELYPIGLHPMGTEGSLRPKVASHYLLEKMRLAGITRAYFILRSGKWDIPAYFGDGTLLTMHLGYLIMNLPYGVAYTLDQAYPFVHDSLVALGFPDVLFRPRDAYARLLTRQSTTGADVVLGLFPSSQPEKVGMVDADETGRVRLIVEKPRTSQLRYMWAIAVWTPTFTQFLHDYVATIEQQRATGDDTHLPTLTKELPIGDVIQAAIDQGLVVQSEPFPQGCYLDIGTPEDLLRATRESAQW
ncbi:MAG: sugar phosphate nucleotidyltransferase [Cyanobacteria bacterium]|nr:sugar phosphate nucleotidyltransferase [Cyanobacteriota bacterium]MDW8202318.1 sugar phosphate nucleotidyltransferase [Cyanobacteriota bacterium SKYGB_h_bin112]